MAALVAAIGAKSVTPALVLLGVLIAVVIALGLFLLMLRATMFRKDPGHSAHAGMFDHLRDMRDRGEISPEEFDAAKAAMVSRVSGKAATSPPGAKTASKPLVPKAKGRVAPPGVDLTGEPLPPHESGGDAAR